MILTRKQFLEKLVTFVAAASVAPQLVASLEATVDAHTSLSVPPIDYPKLTLPMLEQAHAICSYGYAEPDMVLMSPDSYAHFMVEWTKLPEAARFVTSDNDVSLPSFNGASVTFSKALPRRSWLMINSKHPETPHYSGLFTAGDSAWHPIPKELPNG